MAHLVFNEGPCVAGRKAEKHRRREQKTRIEGKKRKKMRRKRKDEKNLLCKLNASGAGPSGQVGPFRPQNQHARVSAR